MIPQEEALSFVPWAKRVGKSSVYSSMLVSSVRWTSGVVFAAPLNIQLHRHVKKGGGKFKFKIGDAGKIWAPVWAQILFRGQIELRSCIQMGSGSRKRSDCAGAADWWQKRHCVTTMLYRLMNVAMALKTKDA